MQTLDWIVIGLFCAGLIGIVIWVLKQKQNSSSDYFLGGKDTASGAPLPACWRG